MKQLLFILSIFLVACTSNKTGKNALGSDTIPQDSVVQPEMSALTPTDVIDGMGECDMPNFGIKAWISDGNVYWNVYDVEKYQRLSGTDSEFYRIGDGPHLVEGLDEQAVGVFMAKLTEKGDLALYIIGHRRHLYAFDISLEVSGVGGGVGLLADFEDVQTIEQEGMTVYAYDSEGYKKQVELYSGQGPFQCAVMDGENEYYFEFSTTWNMRIVKDNNEHYAGRFRRGSNGYYTYTLTSYYHFDDQWRQINEEIEPIHGSFRMNVKKSTIMFDESTAGLPKGVALPYEIQPLFE